MIAIDRSTSSDFPIVGAYRIDSDGEWRARFLRVPLPSDRGTASHGVDLRLPGGRFRPRLGLAGMCFRLALDGCRAVPERGILTGRCHNAGETFE